MERAEPRLKKLWGRRLIPVAVSIVHWAAPVSPLVPISIIIGAEFVVATGDEFIARITERVIVVRLLELWVYTFIKTVSTIRCFALTPLALTSDAVTLRVVIPTHIVDRGGYLVDTAPDSLPRPLRFMNTTHETYKEQATADNPNDHTYLPQRGVSGSIRHLWIERNRGRGDFSWIAARKP